MSTHPIQQLVPFRRRVVERVVVETDVDFAEEIVATETIEIPNHNAQGSRVQLTLRNVILSTISYCR